MNKIGIKKKLDNLGRLCIPKFMRELFELTGEVELVVTEDGILLKKSRMYKRKTSKKETNLRISNKLETSRLLGQLNLKNYL